MKPVMMGAFVLLVGLVAISCGPTYVRGSEVEGLDEYAMSTGLDKRDLEQLFEENIKSFMDSAVVARWQNNPEPPVLALFPIANETSEHIGAQLEALLTKMETRILNAGVATVVDRERQGQLIAEVQAQQGAAFDEGQSTIVGRQLGAKYFLSGKVYDNSERDRRERRVQYMFFLKLVEVETGRKLWQNEANLTKGLVR